MKKSIFIATAGFLFSTTLHAQGWIGSAPDVLYPVNSSLGFTPLSVGIGTNTPTEQLHTTEGVRFEGLKQSQKPERFVVQDKNGVLYWYPFSGTGGGNAWDLNGNAGTVPGTNYLGTSDNQRLAIATNAQERVSVASTGEVGIGTIAPTMKLQVYEASNDMTMAVSGGSPSIKFHENITTPPNAPSSFTTRYAKIGLATSYGDFVTTSVPGDFVMETIDTNKSLLFSARYNIAAHSGTEQMRLTSAGRLGIGTTTPTQILTVFNGTTTGTYTTAGWVSSSDKRLKNDIQPINNAMDLVRKLNGVYFQWIGNKDAGRQLGFIAQDVCKVLPEVVVGKEGDMAKGETLGMAYQNIVPVLVEALKEKDQQISELQQRMDAMKDKDQQIEQLQQRLDRIESALNHKTDNAATDNITLDQNVPNPFTAYTSISYTIPQAGNVVVELYTQDGVKIRTLENGNRDKGQHTVQISDSDLSAGTYIYTLSLNGRKLSRKAIKL